MGQVRATDTRTFNRRRILGVTAGSVAGVAILSAVGLPRLAQATSRPVSNLYIALVSDAMTGKPNFPVYVPSDITVPANSTIKVQIAQFDDGTGQLPDGSSYAKVTGVSGASATGRTMTLTDPNHPGVPAPYQQMAAGDVAHTFTLGALGVNVPLPASSVVTFSFQTGEAGDHAFQCMVPCGVTPQGFGGPMAESGYMVGTLHVV
jgi:hypothetical protein